MLMRPLRRLYTAAAASSDLRALLPSGAAATVTAAASAVSKRVCASESVPAVVSLLRAYFGGLPVGTASASPPTFPLSAVAAHGGGPLAAGARRLCELGAPGAAFRLLVDAWRLELPPKDVSRYGLPVTPFFEDGGALPTVPYTPSPLLSLLTGLSAGAADGGGATADPSAPRLAPCSLALLLALRAPGGMCVPVLNGLLRALAVRGMPDGALLQLAPEAVSTWEARGGVQLAVEGGHEANVLGAVSLLEWGRTFNPAASVFLEGGGGAPGGRSDGALRSAAEALAPPRFHPLLDLPAGVSPVGRVTAALLRAALDARDGAPAHAPNGGTLAAALALARSRGDVELVLGLGAWYGVPLTGPALPLAARKLCLSGAPADAAALIAHAQAAENEAAARAREKALTREEQGRKRKGAAGASAAASPAAAAPDGVAAQAQAALVRQLKAGGAAPGAVKAAVAQLLALRRAGDSPPPAPAALTSVSERLLAAAAARAARGGPSMSLSLPPLAPAPGAAIAGAYSAAVVACSASYAYVPALAAWGALQEHRAVPPTVDAVCAALYSASQVGFAADVYRLVGWVEAMRGFLVRRFPGPVTGAGTGNTAPNPPPPCALARALADAHDPSATLLAAKAPALPLEAALVGMAHCAKFLRAGGGAVAPAPSEDGAATATAFAPLLHRLPWDERACASARGDAASDAFAFHGEPLPPPPWARHLHPAHPAASLRAPPPRLLAAAVRSLAALGDAQYVGMLLLRELGRCAALSAAAVAAAEAGDMPAAAALRTAATLDGRVASACVGGLATCGELRAAVAAARAALATGARLSLPALLAVPDNALGRDDIGVAFQALRLAAAAGRDGWGEGSEGEGEGEGTDVGGGKSTDDGFRRNPDVLVLRVEAVLVRMLARMREAGGGGPAVSGASTAATAAAAELEKAKAEGGRRERERKFGAEGMSSELAADGELSWMTVARLRALPASTPARRRPGGGTAYSAAPSERDFVSASAALWAAAPRSGNAPPASRADRNDASLALRGVSKQLLEASVRAALGGEGGASPPAGAPAETPALVVAAVSRWAAQRVVGAWLEGRSSSCSSGDATAAATAPSPPRFAAFEDDEDDESDDLVVAREMAALALAEWPLGASEPPHVQELRSLAHVPRVRAAVKRAAVERKLQLHNGGGGDGGTGNALVDALSFEDFLVRLSPSHKEPPRGALFCAPVAGAAPLELADAENEEAEHATKERVVDSVEREFGWLALNFSAKVKSATPQRGVEPRRAAALLPRQCASCGEHYQLSPSEAIYFTGGGIHAPTSCLPCRTKRKVEQKESEQMGAEDALKREKAATARVAEIKRGRLTAAVVVASAAQGAAST